MKNYHVIFLLLGLSFFYGNFSGDIINAATTDLHIADQDCIACHNSIMQSSGQLPPTELSSNLNEDCLQCHVDNDVSARFIHIAQLEGQQLTESLSKTSPKTNADDGRGFKKASGKGPGMNVTMYYEKSRIGDQPNQMVFILGGEFVMGSNSRLPDEAPEHKVMLNGFWIDKYEVTNFQYKKFIDETKWRSPSHFENRTFPANKIDHPVTFVSWKDASAYCEWAGKKLPSDKEWEKAARGTDVRIYPWGDVYHTDKVNSPQRWLERKLEGDTTPVGAFGEGKSPYGLYDMSGNVWEWTASWYQAYPGNTHASENYGQTYKTLKGGSWWNCSFYKCGISAPTFNRSFFLRSTKNKSFGFRCAKDAVL
ncbi:MAG: formylglycine-generating enzyme family protein [Gammaproteobacteria bacterium]|nr:formylglycine-generating enzyme family protein [Gammaproteobacteria bacterium]